MSCPLSHSTSFAHILSRYVLWASCLLFHFEKPEIPENLRPISMGKLAPIHFSRCTEVTCLDAFFWLGEGAAILRCSPTIEVG